MAKTLGIFVIAAIVAFPQLQGCSTRDAASVTSVVDASAIAEIPLDQVRILMNRRQFRQALTILEQEKNRSSTNPVLYFLAGECYFRTARYRKAITSFRQSLSLNPNQIDARHRLWAAQLQAAADIHDERRKLKQLLDRLRTDHANNVNTLIAVYHGYGYLWDRKQQLSLAKEIIRKNIPAQSRIRVGQILETEIILARDRFVRGELSRIYVDRFLGTGNDEIPVAALFYSIGEREPGSLIAETEHLVLKIPANPYVNYFGARALVKAGNVSTGPIKLLRKNIELLRKSEKEQVAKRFLAKNFVLLGTTYYKRGSYALAKRWLKKGLTIDPLNADGSYFLGLTYEKEHKRKQAVHYLLRTLNITGKIKAAETELSRLLVDKPSGTQNISRFLVKKSNVTTFSDVTDSVGLGNIPSHRVAWGDYDNDGDDDLLVDGNRLFQNSANTFLEVTTKAFGQKIYKANGGIWGDYNNDGLPDIFVTTKNRNRLLENSGRGYFIDVTRKVLPQETPANSEAAAWGNLNQDAYPDLYVANYQQPAVERAVCSKDTVLINNSGKIMRPLDQRLVNYTTEAMCGRGVAWADYDNDGHQDIFVSNYRLDPNFLWVNDGELLTNRATTTNVAGHEVNGAYGNSIGPVFADFNNDGKLDLFVANLAHPRDLAFSDESQLYMNDNGKFADTYQNSGIRYQETYSDPAVSDIDNDGDLDLYITATYSSGESHLYLNDGNGRFTDRTWLSGTRLSDTWGGAFSDFDNDGDMDLVVASKNGLRLLRNNGNSNNWIKLRLRQDQCNRLGISSRIELRYKNTLQIREIAAGRGTGNQDSLDQVFGLGSYRGPVSIRIRNACGRTSTHNISQFNHMITLKD
jgi:tetratricopeptide (TPR) repeat protein